MRSIPQIIKFGLAAGSRGFAAELVEQQVDEMEKVLGYTRDAARTMVLRNIGYYTGYLDHETADKVMGMFETEHPVWGKSHPSQDEILRLGIEHGQRLREKRV